MRAENAEYRPRCFASHMTLRARLSLNKSLPRPSPPPPLTNYHSLDNDVREHLRILEQATAACWGSLAVMDR